MIVIWSLAAVDHSILHFPEVPFNVRLRNKEPIVSMQARFTHPE